jgi:hypothetical protein
LGDPVTPDEIQAAVIDWFARVRTAGLKLPSGWFGRPFDNLHRLTGAHVLADRLVLALDDRLVLVLARPSQVTERDGNLVISGFVHAVFDWDAYGSDEPHLNTFADGEVEFVAP